MSKAKYQVLLCLFAIAFLASAVLAFIPLEQACGGTGTTCYAVQTSPYETTLGIKNAYIGLFAFTLIGTLAYLQIKYPGNKERKQLIQFGLILGTVYAIYFLYIQFFVLNAVCKYCMVVDFATMLSLGITIFWKEK